MLHRTTFPVIAATALAAALTCEAQQYGRNYAAVRKDSEVIASAFPEPDEVLYGPAFEKPESVPVETFANGTSGPTPDAELGMSV